MHYEVAFVQNGLVRFLETKTDCRDTSHLVGRGLYTRAEAWFVSNHPQLNLSLSQVVYLGNMAHKTKLVAKVEEF